MIPTAGSPAPEQWQLMLAASLLAGMLIVTTCWLFTMRGRKVRLWEWFAALAGWAVYLGLLRLVITSAI